MADNVKISADQLTATVKRILEEYGDQGTLAVQRAGAQMGKLGAKMVNASASSVIHGRRGKYEKSWTSKTTMQRMGVEAVIYSNQPGLPHLLEHGHSITYLGGVKSKGPGHASAYPHIAKVDEELAELFPKEIEREISKI